MNVNESAESREMVGGARARPVLVILVITMHICI